MANASILYRTLTEPELNRSLFSAFVRRQVVVDCWRRENGGWAIKPDPFIDDWSEEDYAYLLDCLRNTVRTGGFVCGAFTDGALKGFVSVEPGFTGPKGEYLDLSSLHVSAGCRGQGIGRELFARAAAWAEGRGAEKLYISSHSAVETQAFYNAMGCTDAGWISAEHAEKEPFDRQLEYVL